MWDEIKKVYLNCSSGFEKLLDHLLFDSSLCIDVCSST